MSRRHAAFIARDQNAKMTSFVVKERRLECGIREAIWMHSHGGRKPRPSHVKAGREKLIFDIAKGAFIDGEWIQPGELINCRCMSKSIIPGYNDPREMAQDAWNDDQPRDEKGRWTSGGAHHAELQEKHKHLLDRLQREQGEPRPYGDKQWKMPSSGYDTRKEKGLSRPVVIGEIPHPLDSSKSVPLVVKEGRQLTNRSSGGGEGRRHMEYRHGQEYRDLGFRNALHYATWLAENHDIRFIDNRNGLVTGIMPKKEGEKANMAVFSMKADGDHYSIVTAYPIPKEELLGKKEEADRGSLTPPRNAPNRSEAQDTTTGLIMTATPAGPGIPPASSYAEDSAFLTDLQPIPLYPPEHPCWL